MRIKKAELKAIVKEELGKLLKEINRDDAGRVADLLRTPGGGVPSIELLQKSYDLIDNIKKHALTQKGDTCADWVDLQAKRRKWNNQASSLPKKKSQKRRKLLETKAEKMKTKK